MCLGEGIARQNSNALRRTALSRLHLERVMRGGTMTIAVVLAAVTANTLSGSRGRNTAISGR